MSERSQKSTLKVSVDIPGITESTRLGDLTVEQFTLLLQQVSGQIAADRESPEVVRAELARIRLLTTLREAEVARIQRREAALSELDEMVPNVVHPRDRAIRVRSRGQRTGRTAPRRLEAHFDEAS